METGIEKRKLGKNGLEITTVGFGAWAAGGPWKVGWGPQSDEDSIAAIRRSVELGCNWIDTAAIYGLGHSEVVVGQAMEGLRREEVLIATKCGRVADANGTPYGDLRPEVIRQQMEDSLKRLKMDYVDLYQIHWPDPDVENTLELAWQTLVELQQQGKTRYIGVSNFNVAQMERCQAIAHIDSLQPPFSLLRRDIEESILPWCHRNGTGVIVYSPMQAGLLSGTFDINKIDEGDWRRRNPYFTEPNLTKNLAYVEKLRPIAESHGKTVGQLAIAWTLAQPGVTAAIVGARRPEQVEMNVEAMGWKLTDAELAEIASFS